MPPRYTSATVPSSIKRRNRTNSISSMVMPSLLASVYPKYIDDVSNSSHNVQLQDPIGSINTDKTVSESDNNDNNFTIQQLDNNNNNNHNNLTSEDNSTLRKRDDDEDFVVISTDIPVPTPSQDDQDIENYERAMFVDTTSVYEKGSASNIDVTNTHNTNIPDNLSGTGGYGSSLSSLTSSTLSSSILSSLSSSFLNPKSSQPK